MIAAERQYQYRSNYRKYEFERKAQAVELNRKKNKKNSAAIRAKDKVRMLALIFFAGTLATALIIVTAYSAKVQYDINNVLAKCDVVQGEIQNLNVEIKTGSNIRSIEERAIEQGMVYPGFENMVYLDTRAEGKDMKNFALALKENAYSQNQ